MNILRLLSLLPAVILVLGCNPPHIESSFVPPPSPPPAQPTAKLVSSCEILRSKFNHGTTQITKIEAKENIERQLQRVMRKNCAGEIISNEVETVSPPHLELTLANPKPRYMKSVFVFNEQTCDHRLTELPIQNWPLLGAFYSVTGDGKKQITIKGDLSDALFTFKLATGFNRIFVQYFYDCSPKAIEGNSHVSIGTGTCDFSSDSLIVEYPLIVNSEEKTLPGVKEISPSPEECKPK